MAAPKHNRQQNRPPAGEGPETYPPSSRDSGHITAQEGNLDRLTWHPPRHAPGAPHARMFRRVRPGLLIAEEEAIQPTGGIGRAWASISHFLFGSPIPSTEEASERVGRLPGLAIFASDNISSSAYATEEIMRVLVLAGLGALSLTMPITIAICVVLAIVVTSYQQVIRAYPNGGGSYIVAKENLGDVAGLIAGSALFTDYVLTVSVSVAAGIAAITSVFPTLDPIKVWIMVAVIVLMTIVNLRGIRESGSVFAIPTYVYVVSLLGLIVYGGFRYLTGTMPQYVPPPAWIQADQSAAEGLSLILLLRAFASGSVALSGIEAVSNGVPAFKPPEIRNAQSVLIMMGTLFGVIFLGIGFLAGHLGIVPDPTETETVVSQVARSFVGDGPYFYLVQFSTFVILVLAANTSFNGLPRLAGVMAHDRFMPRLFAFRGDRLAYTAGIVLLAIAGILLIVLFDGSVTHLIPLYTIGVFVAFTLSQAGMVRHWLRRRSVERGWRWRAAVNAVGTATTGLVAFEVAISKFALGAWIVLILIPLMVLAMWMIHVHFRWIAGAQRPETPLNPQDIHPRVVVPIANLAVPARQALAFAEAIAGKGIVIAVHVTDDPASVEALRAEWDALPHGNARLVAIESPYRALSSPLVAFIEAQQERHPDDTIIVVVPEYVPAHWWEHLLHNQTALRLKMSLLFHHGVIVADVPYHAAAVSN